MPFFHVNVRIIQNAYTVVKADDLEEALAMVNDGDYEDIYGEYTDSIEAIDGHQVNNFEESEEDPGEEA
jgi:hypothetical protein